MLREDCMGQPLMWLEHGVRLEEQGSTDFPNGDTE